MIVLTVTIELHEHRDVEDELRNLLSDDYYMEAYVERPLRRQVFHLAGGDCVTLPDLRIVPRLLEEGEVVEGEVMGDEDGNAITL